MIEKHTHGPWEVTRGSDGNYAIADGGIGMVVAWSNATDARHDGCIANVADARLIAAAPELLEALQDMLAQYGCHCGHPVCNDCRRTRDAEAAIAKAIEVTK